MYSWRGLGAAISPSVSTALSNASQQTGVPLSLLESVALKESSYDPNAVSSAGAQGLMQLMPGTAASLGVSNPFDPSQSALGGATYLEQLYSKYGNWNDALVAYNEGPGAFDASGAYASSASYAASVLAGAALPDTTLPQAVDSGSVDSTGVYNLDLSTLSDGSVNWTWIGLGLAGVLALLWAVK